MNKLRIPFVLILLVSMLFTSCLLPPEPETTPEIIPEATQTPEPAQVPEPTALAGDAWLSMAEETLPEYIPIETLLSFNEYYTPQISDDGMKIFYRHTTANTDGIEILDRETGGISYVPLPDVITGGLYYILTPDPDRVLLFMDTGNNESYGLYTADLKNNTTNEILPADSYDCSLVGFNPVNDDEAYIAVFNFDLNVYDLYSIDFKEESAAALLMNPGNIVNWIFDSQGRLAIVETINEDASVDIWLKNDMDSENQEFVEDEWTRIITWEYEDASASNIIDYDDKEGSLLLFDSSIENSTAVVSYDIDTGEKTIVDIDDQGIYDPAGLWVDITTNDATGVAYLRDRLEWEALDASFQPYIDDLGSVQDGEFNIYDSSEDDRYWLVSYSSDTKAPDYYLYDSETMEETFLFNANPALSSYEYSPMEPVSFQSSDGLTIHGYATFPANMERRDLPLVVVVHGGPWARDTWGFNPEVQFLANRGYMVLQVNFRGSTGYGKDFILAGDMEWSRKMHTDIMDGVDWAVSQGWADPGRVAIYGASYGGYEALVSAAFDSESFACAIDMFGPSSLLTLVSSQPPQWDMFAKRLYRSIGDPANDAVMMMERSPYYYIDGIDIPLLVVQGGNDVRVTQQESDQLVNAMRQAGLPVDYIFFPEAGHGFSSDAQVRTVYEKVEAFLAENIGGRSHITDQEGRR